MASPRLEELAASKSKGRTRSVKVGPCQAGWAEPELFDPSDMGLRERLTVMAEAAQKAGTAQVCAADCRVLLGSVGYAWSRAARPIP